MDHIIDLIPFFMDIIGFPGTVSTYTIDDPCKTYKKYNKIKN